VTETLDRRRVRISPGEILYVDEGSGPPVVLLHGFPTSAHLWSDLAPLLAPHFHVIAPDLVGYGDSEKPAAAPLDMEAQAKYVREFLEQIGVTEYAAVGHDLGGGVAQLLALEGTVRSLVLVDSMTLGPPGRSRTPTLVEAAQVDGAAAEAFVRAHFDRGLSRRARLSEEDLDEFVRPWLLDPPALSRAAHGAGANGASGFADKLKDLDVPTLVLWGEDDPFRSSRLAEALWERLPDASIALLPGCSHYVTLDAPETALPLINQFLRRRYLGEEGHGHAHVGRPVTVDLGVSFERPPHPGDELVDE
jgi:2-hydroxymuconate-semialdehyde hydrolase